MAGKGTTIQIAPTDVGFLEKRGARSHRGGGEFSRSAVLHRSLQVLRNILDYSDPRKTRGFAPELHELAIQLLRSPWNLTSFEVEHLPTILERAPDFAAATAEAGVEAGSFLAEISSFTFPEKVALVDHAIQMHAPAASAAAPEEP
jgi:hypothetical protein